MPDAALLDRPPYSQPVRREKPLYLAATLARAALQAYIVRADVTWENGWTGYIGPGSVMIYEKGEPRIIIPIYEAARLTLETDKDRVE